MSEIILIAWAKTDWAEQGRLIGRTDLPLNESGRAAATAIAEQLDAAPPDAIKSGPEEEARETARIIAKRFRLRLSRPIKELAEINLGLWSGLTEAELQQRFTGAHEQWRENPEAICPPEGETIGDALARLNRAVERMAHKQAAGRLGMVVGPMAAAALRCHLSDKSFDHFWRYYDEGSPVHRVIVSETASD